MKKDTAIKCGFLLAYILIVLYITDFSRDPMLVPDLDRVAPFWSYALWFHGDWQVGLQIIENIMMFTPFGFVLAWLLDAGSSRKRAGLVVLIGLCFSILIESSQMVLRLGTFEFDDLLDNTLGACVGLGLYLAASRTIGSNKLRTVMTGAACFCIAFGVFVCFYFVERQDNYHLEKQYAFQVTDVSLGDGAEVQGFCFAYTEPDMEYEIWLKDTKDGTITELETECGLESKLANDYYKCEYDYLHGGFTARTGEALAPDAEYEVLVKWPRMKAISTESYINRKVPEELAELAGDAALDAVIRDGILKVSEPDRSCWVYQYGGELYWFAGPDFDFEEDGSTYIQYQLNTTQVEKMPAERLANGWDWDNIGFVFEENEVPVAGGGFRVAVRPLPTEYAITAIVTGYYNSYKWVWSRYFRPEVESVEVN